MALPPDLDRLGDQLVAAARRSSARRERRRRLVVSGVVGALAFAGLTPAPLGPADRTGVLEAAASEDFAPPGCDHARGARYTLAACERAKVQDRPRAWH